MLQEIIFGAVVVVVAGLMVADVVRTRHEGTHGPTEAQDFDAMRLITAASASGRELFSRAPADSSVPAALPTRNVASTSQFAGPSQSAAPSQFTAPSRSAAPSQFAGAGQHAGAGQFAGPSPAAAVSAPGGAGPAGAGRPRPQATTPAPGGSRRRLKNRPVRSRLLLLVAVPLAAAAVIGACVSYLIDQAQRPQTSSDGLVLSVLAAIIVIAVVVASLLTIAVARSVLVPVYKLRAGAREVSGPRLANAIQNAGQYNASQYSASQNNASQNGPGRDGAASGLTPIDVDASDELGEIARSFDGVRQELLRLAAGEASQHGKLNTTFVDLSNRGQSLMERQIRLLQHLEQGEPDPERLAALFRAKRIASRMHRHSENLLILLGHEPSNNWNQPVALAHVIRAAVSEIEENQRVLVNAQPAIAVVGPAANDVVHMLIELSENATSFSAADMQVEISGRPLASGGVLLEITDRGVGMTPNELSRANWQLENPPATEGTIPRWIGLLVVARLAARHGIKVRLQPADYGGLTAMVWLPGQVLTEPGASAANRLAGAGSAAGIGARRGLHEAAASGPVFAPAQPVAPPVGRQARHAGLPVTVEAAVPSRTEPFGAHAAVADQPNRDFPIAAAPVAAAPVVQDASPATDSVIVPPPGDRGAEHRLPVFNAVESSWFQQGRGAPDTTPSAGPRWSSPADAGWRAASAADPPSSAGSTDAGLPKRMPNANLIPGAISGSEPMPPMPPRSPAAIRQRLSALQHGTDKGRAAASRSAGEDEDGRPGPNS